MSLAEWLFAALQPSNAIVFLIALGALLLPFRRGVGRVLLGLGIVLLAVVGFLPVGQALLRPLETRVTAPTITAPPDAIIVLGGYLHRSVRGEAEINFNDNADRLTAAASLAQRWPGVPIVISDGGVEPDPRSGAELSADWLESVGVSRDRIILEGRSHSTRDNAVMSKEIVQPQPDGRYLLVTSAWHMPRALATFRTAGWPDPIPYPVDPMTGTGPISLLDVQPVANGLSDADLAAREYTALLWYWATGRTDRLIP